MRLRHRAMLLALLTLAALPVRSQGDSTWLSRNSQHLVPTLAGATLMGTGTLLTFNSTANTLAVDIRDGVQEWHLPRMHFDDYLQYAPAALPLGLSLAGLKGRHTAGRIALLEGASYLLGAGWLNAFKYKFGVLRPDGSTYNSFPSGHTFTAFTGAELVRREYGESHPWVAAAAYAAAATVAFMRVCNNRHWAGDVLAGAGLGILSVTLVYWVLD